MSTTEDDLTKEPASGNALPKKRVGRIRNRLAQAAQGVSGALGLRGPSEEEIAAEKNSGKGPCGHVLSRSIDNRKV